MRERSHDGAPAAAKRGERRKGGENERKMRNSWKERSQKKGEEAP